MRAAGEALADLGAMVEMVSIPTHLSGMAIWSAISTEGATEAMMKGNVFGSGWRGLYVTSLRAAHAGWRQRADELSDSVKATMLIGHYLATRHHGTYYAKAQNLARGLRAAYDAALTRHDLLLMPTSPAKAGPLPPAGGRRGVALAATVGTLGNTSPFNVSGHPAISVPCGSVAGLPVGMMLVGRHFDESTLYRAAAALERHRPWS